MKIPMEYTHFGYEFLDKVPGGKIHSGIDLNYGSPSEDLGKSIYATDDGEVVYARFSSGWGNMIVIKHNGCFSRYAHLEEMKVSIGERVSEGMEIGTCGGTGGDWKPHLHFDIIIKELPSWTNYTTGFSESNVLEYYADPLEYIKNHNSDNKIVKAISIAQKISARMIKKKDTETQRLAAEIIELLKNI